MNAYHDEDTVANDCCKELSYLLRVTYTSTICMMDNDPVG